MMINQNNTPSPKVYDLEEDILTSMQWLYKKDDNGFYHYHWMNFSFKEWKVALTMATGIRPEAIMDLTLEFIEDGYKQSRGALELYFYADIFPIENGYVLYKRTGGLYQCLFISTSDKRLDYLHDARQAMVMHQRVADRQDFSREELMKMTLMGIKEESYITPHTLKFSEPKPLSTSKSTPEPEPKPLSIKEQLSKLMDLVSTFKPGSNPRLNASDTVLLPYMDMPASNPNNDMWLYKKINGNWVKAKETNQTSREYWQENEFIHGLHDLSERAYYEGNNLSPAMVEILRDGEIDLTLDGYVFRHSKATLQSNIIFISGADLRLSAIRRMRNLDRFDYLLGNMPMELGQIAEFTGLSKGVSK